MEIIEKIKDFDYKSLFKKKKEKAELVWFAATKANIHHFKPGMFWYEDNTLSSEIFVGKALQAIVVKVSHGKVIGLLPVERIFDADEAVAFEEKIPKVLEDGLLKLRSKMPRLSDWCMMYEYRDVINHSLAEAGWLPLSGIYWCWTGWFRNYLSGTYNFETAQKSKTANSAKGRYLIELTLI